MQSATPKDALVRFLAEILESQRDALLLDGDFLSSSWAGGLRESFEGRFLDAGAGGRILVGLAAGLASASDFAPVIVGEGDRLLGDGANTFLDSVARVGLNVKALAVESEESWLASRGAAREIAVLRAAGGVAVVQPADLDDARRLLQVAFSRKAPAYFRIVAHSAEPGLEWPKKAAWGKFESLRDGDEVTILATGPATLAAVRAGEALANDGAPCRVAHAHTLSPLDTKFLADAARQTLGIVVAEPHATIGGLGAAVAERVTDEHSCLVRRAVPATGKTFGSAEQWIAKLAERIVAEAKYVMENA